MRTIRTKNVLKFRHESASAEVVLWPERQATLKNVYSMKRRQGHAKGLLEKIMKWADDNEYDLLLAVRRYGYADKLSPDDEGLVEFYNKFGFQVLKARMSGQPCLMQRLHNTPS